ncbi:acyl-CoA carboxylase subunit beta [Actinopolyspora mortivallis]|uniref:Methylmalonyl-CoA carboxyltransferase n=1 Tax=Actinopolyspora mortivallis TaxID=33906 RepID=A0A2T0GX48_ACTMO|nr:acyl-CoA carboxylase subunit beta [Actinopolyspora mortivallis]PRW63681.1 methylmalonyl-CoA carboxyltransferase [Actinopolyspora mortivallis]
MSRDSHDEDSESGRGAEREHAVQQSAEELLRRRDEIVEGPSPQATEQQRARGKLTVRERLDILLDENTFVEIQGHRRHSSTAFGMQRRRPAGDGVVTGWGEIEGRTVFVYAHDFRALGGSLGESHAAKIHQIMDMAEAAGAPLVSLNDGSGARIQEGVNALAGYGGIFRRNVRLSGVVPQISVILGPCAGGAAYSPALTDFVFMVRGVSRMFVTGPDVVHTVTAESITHEQLGGADVHAESSGVATFVHEDERSCLRDVRYLVSLLPSNNQQLPPCEGHDDPLDRPNDTLTGTVPADSKQSYDMNDVIAEIVDDGEYIGVHSQWARNVICVLARVAGHVVGIVANQPSVLAGVLDISASEKASRFVRLCDAFSIPLITLVDIPGFLPGKNQEHKGIIRHGAKLLYAYCSATVPRIQVIIRKAYGGAYIVMDSGSIGADLSFAWPNNEIAVMGAEAAAGVIFRKEIENSSEPEETRAARTQEYRDELMHPYYAAEHGLVDDVIDPAETRRVLARSLKALHAKAAPLAQRKHGNGPM